MLTVLLLALAVMQAQTAPLGPEIAPTIIHTILFKRQVLCDCSGPIERTLVDIIRSCILTIAACVYRAIHQNIPDPKASWWERQWIKIRIAFFALVAPEAVLWWAMRQWFGAKLIADNINLIKPELKWTRTHGHFVQMGGLGRKDNEKILPPLILVDLLRSGRIHVDELRRISEKRIQDKSKGDALSKIVIAFQTGWFVFECLARFQQRLHVTELEVATLALATINGFMYCFWWHKPLNVLCTIYIEVGVPPPRNHLSTLDSVNLQAPSQDSNDESSETQKLIPLRQSGGKTLPTDSGTGVRSMLTRMPRNFQARMKERGWMVVFDWFILAPCHGILSIVHGMIRTFGQLFGEAKVPDDASYVPTFYAVVPEYELYWTPFIAAVTGIIFGAVHIFSWNSSFPSDLERSLWRISTVILVAGLPFTALMGTLGTIFETISDRSAMRSWVFIMARAISYFFFSIVIIVLPLSYIFARLCILALAFLTLRDLPPDTFQAIAWTSYIPHF